MLGTVFSIEEFSVYDGPGIRTTVFLKGCPLRCTWCHNPEGQSPRPEIVRSPNGCIGCHACERLGVYEDGRLRFTGESIRCCPQRLLRLCGEELSAADLCDRLLKNRNILQKGGGGVTFSGGEPLYQGEFLLECLSALKGQLHTAVQTCGFAKPELFSLVLEHTDYMLFDLKIYDTDLHEKYTGVPNAPILENFRRLVRSGVPFVPRIPLIPGVTDTEENLGALAALLRENGVTYAEVLPYHKMAGGKYKMLLREYNPGFDECQESQQREELFCEYGINIQCL